MNTLFKWLMLTVLLWCAYNFFLDSQFPAIASLLPSGLSFLGAIGLAGLIMFVHTLVED